MHFHRFLTASMVHVWFGAGASTPWAKTSGEALCGRRTWGQRRVAGKPAQQHLNALVETGLLLRCLPHLDIGHSTVLAVLRALVPLTYFAAPVFRNFPVCFSGSGFGCGAGAMRGCATGPHAHPATHGGCVTGESLSRLRLDAVRGRADPAALGAANTETEIQAVARPCRRGSSARRLAR